MGIPYKFPRGKESPLATTLPSFLLIRHYEVKTSKNGRGSTSFKLVPIPVCILEDTKTQSKTCMIVHFRKQYTILNFSVQNSLNVGMVI